MNSVMVAKDLIIIRALRTIARTYSKTKFTSQDLIDIANGHVLKVYQRLGSDKKETPARITGKINENKDNFVGKESPKRSFTETPADPEKWLIRLAKIKSELGLAQDESLSVLRDKLVELSAKSKATKKAVGLKNSDIRFLIENISKETDEDTQEDIDVKEDTNPKE